MGVLLSFVHKNRQSQTFSPRVKSSKTYSCLGLRFAPCRMKNIMRRRRSPPSPPKRVRDSSRLRNRRVNLMNSLGNTSTNGANNEARRRKNGFARKRLKRRPRRLKRKRNASKKQK